MSQLESLLLLLLLHFFEGDILKDRVDDWLGLFRCGNLRAGHGHNSLSHDAFTIDAEVLEEGMGNESVSREILEVFNLLVLRCFFEVKFVLI